MSTFGLINLRLGWTPGSEQFHSQLLRGLGDEVTGRGHTVIVKIVADRAEELATYTQWAADGSVDVVVLEDIAVGDDLEDQVRSLGLACVVLGDTRQPVAAGAVLVDNTAGLRLVIDHLRDTGHRRIDWITGPQTQFHTHIRRQAFAAYVRDGLISGTAQAVDYDPERCRSFVRAEMAGARPPTAFLVDGDALSVVTIECVRQNGYRVPDDVSVISWDDTVTCQRADPPVTALEHHIGELGRSVGRCLMAAAEGRQVREVGQQPQLVLRSSSS